VPSGDRDVIVTCEECSTSFQLDDTRIPASGARVRCSRCKHAFFLPNPSSSQSQAVQTIVEEAIQGKAGRTPTPTRDLGRAPAVASGPALLGEPEEEDWQFSQEIRVADDDDERDEAASGLAGSPDPSSFDLTGDFGRGFDPDSSASANREKPAHSGVAASKPAATAVGPGSAPTRVASLSTERKPTDRNSSGTPTPEPQRDESIFGSVDDFSSLIDDEEVSIDLATDSVAPPSRSPRAAAAASDDLGDPESWDLVGGDEARHAKSTVAALVRPPNPPARKPAPATSLDLFAEGDAAPVYDDLESPVGTHRHWARAGKLVGWCVTAASIAVTGGLLLRSESDRWTDRPQRLEVGPLVAETTRSGWLESSRAGFLLVIKGEIRNTGNQPVKPVPLQLTLLDGAGERLAEPPISVGRTLTEQALRESRPKELAAQIDRAVAGFRATPLAPGEVRRFLAIVPADQLPAGARRVLLEIEHPVRP